MNRTGQVVFGVFTFLADVDKYEFVPTVHAFLDGVDIHVSRTRVLALSTIFKKRGGCCWAMNALLRLGRTEYGTKLRRTEREMVSSSSIGIVRKTLPRSFGLAEPFRSLRALPGQSADSPRSCVLERQSSPRSTRNAGAVPCRWNRCRWQQPWPRRGEDLSRREQPRGLVTTHPDEKAADTAYSILEAGQISPVRVAPLMPGRRQ